MLAGLVATHPISQGSAADHVTSELPQRVAELELDLAGIHKWDDSNGDTWDPFWADDDHLYSFNCDGRGFGKTAQNLAFNRFDGPNLSGLKGVSLNSMSEYGIGEQHGKDNATWKACGQECIDGVFYSFVSRNVYGDQSNDPLMRQTAFNSSLIKSSDRGLTWKRSAQENYDHPMWPGPYFGAPCFVHFGKNGGNVQQDGAAQYVYAVSTNGFWNDGDTLVLGRVPRKSLVGLNPSDWSYFAGGDGAKESSWSKRITETKPILAAPGKLGQTPVCFVPSLGIYLLVSWYNPETLTKWFEPTEMRYDFYQAEHPWGPWSLIRSVSDRFLAFGSHMYGPALCPKFQERSRSEVRLVMFTSGCQFEDVPSSIYKAWTIPVILRATACGRVESWTANDPRLTYAGEWSTPRAGGSSAEIRISRRKGDELVVSFTGSGITYVANKGTGNGTVQAYLDGVDEGLVSLRLVNFPGLSDVAVFERVGLPEGTHTLKIVHVDSEPVNVRAVQIRS